MMVHLILSASQTSSPNLRCSWLDAEGASVVATLPKTQIVQEPDALTQLLELLGVRGKDSEDHAAAESCALAVVHLLPVLLRPFYIKICVMLGPF